MKGPQWKHHIVFEGTGSLACCTYVYLACPDAICLDVCTCVRTYTSCFCSYFSIGEGKENCTAEEPGVCVRVCVWCVCVCVRVCVCVCM